MRETTIAREIVGSFEVHLTVDAPPAQLGLLQQFCHARNWKCIHILLDRGRTPSQPMVTYHDSGSRSEAIVRAKQIATELNEEGFAVTRIKLETSPTAQGVPQREGEPHVPGGYFEHHVKLLRPIGESTASLEPLVVRHAAHLSRNAFCTRTDGHEERFVTVRHFDVDRPTSMNRLNALLADLRTAGEHWLSLESEYAVYDSNHELDAGWLIAE